MPTYLQDSVSNGIAREQALIRRWWHEQHSAQGVLVWEYYLEGKYADAIWFPNTSESGVERPGKQTARSSPLADQEVVMCEAKADLTPEVVGQALVYTFFAKRAGARVAETLVFTETGGQAMREAASGLGLTLVVQPLDESSVAPDVE